MKSKLIILLLFLFFSKGIALAQDSVKTKPINPHGIMVLHKFNPLPIFWGPIPLTAEYRYVREMVVGRNQSFQVGISYLGKSPLYTMIEDSIRASGKNAGMPKMKVSGLRFQMAARTYLSKNHYAPKGLYFGPMISYSTAKFTTDYYKRYDVYIRATHFNINLLMGCQGVIDNRYVFDLFWGIGYKHNSWVEHYSSRKIRSVNINDLPTFYKIPVKFTFGFNLGFAR